METWADCGNHYLSLIHISVNNVLVSMELHLDASIDKLDNLAMNVQIDKEKHKGNVKRDRKSVV